jgi:hypothetical protein
MDPIIDLYRHLMMSPQTPNSVSDYFGWTIAVLLPAAFMAWVAAFIYTHLVPHLRSESGTHERTTLAWAWGWFVAAFIIFVHLLQLAIRNLIPSNWAALPYYVVAGLALLLGYLHRRTLKTQLQQLQRIIQAR